MTDDNPAPKPADGRRNPRKPFYMVLVVTNTDGTVNPEESVDGSHDDLDGAVEVCRDQCETNPEENEDLYIYECRPVRKVSRGKARVQALMKPAK